jgi:hypothetical protein
MSLNIISTKFVGTFVTHIGIFLMEIYVVVGGDQNTCKT